MRRTWAALLAILVVWSVAAAAGPSSAVLAGPVGVSADAGVPGADPPLAVGGARNFLGTGQLLGSDTAGFASEDLHLSVNPYCTDQVNGDRYQSGYVGGTCSGTVNPDYRASGYLYGIDVPEGRSSDLEVWLLDARYNEDAVPSETVVGQTCNYPWPTTWTTLTEAADITGPAQYRKWRTTTQTYGSTVTVSAGTVVPLAVNDRYHLPLGPEVCTPIYGTEAAIDDERQAGSEPFTFTLLAPDATPADDGDNPVLCTRTFTDTTPFEFSFLGSVRWNRMPCAVAPSDPAGRYLVRVVNGGVVTNPEADGSNQFGLVAAYSADGTDPAAVLCDARTDSTCPRVAGVGTTSVKALADTSVARFFLADVPADQEGGVLKVSLFDPGEGGSSIRLLAPTGPDTWAPVPFRWRAAVVGSGEGSSLDVTSSRFNGKVVDLVVDLAGYTPPADNTWWKVEYQFLNGGAVTDRTTWDATMAPRAPGSVTGTVSAPATVDGTTALLIEAGDPWFRSGVPLEPTSSTTGTFTFTDLPVGDYQVYVLPPSGSGLVGRWIGGTGTTRSGARVAYVAADGGTIDLPATSLVVGGALSGTVTDGSAPMAGAEVRAFAQGENWLPRAVATTAGDGSWSITGLAAGTYDLLVVPPAGSPLPSRWYPGSSSRAAGTPVTVSAGQVVAGLDVVLQANGSVSGLVTGPAGVPVPGGRVVLFGPGDTWTGSYQAVTASDGTYTVIGVQPGSYQVRFVPPTGSGLRAEWYEGDTSRAASTTVVVEPGGAAVGIDEELAPA